MTSTTPPVLSAPRDPSRVLLSGNRSAERVSGLTVAFDMLVDGFERAGVPFRLVDKGAIGAAAHVGSFDVFRAANTVSLLLRFLFVVSTVDVVYNTIAPSRLGFFRDAAMIWPSRWLRRRIVLHLFGGGYGLFYASQPEWLQRLIRTTLAQADAIVVEGRLLRNQLAFVPEIDRKLRVVPNGLPVGLDRSNARPKAAPDPGTPVRLLYMSNMIESKGYLDVLETCRVLKETWGRSFTCDFCGAFLQTTTDRRTVTADEARARFDSYVLEHDLGDVVRYHGVVRGSVKEGFLRGAHLFLLPTAFPWEGQPISIIEALAFGTPVLATNYRGIPEEVVDGENGRHVLAGDPAGIADAVRNTMDHPSGYARMSARALSHFDEHFTQDVHVQRMFGTILGG